MYVHFTSLIKFKSINYCSDYTSGNYLFCKNGTYFAKIVPRNYKRRDNMYIRANCS